MLPRRLANGPARLALAALLASVATIAISGCDPRTLAYFLQPFEPMIPPPFEGSLEDKRVVVLCNVASASMDGHSTLGRDLTREFSAILRKKVDGIDVVNPDKVATWIQAHPKWTSPAEIASDFDADIVIFLEVEQFQLQAPGDVNVLHGEAKIHIQAFEMKYPLNSHDKPIKDQPKEPESIYDDFAETEFPEGRPIPYENGSSRSKFHIKFVKVVAKHVSWHFLEHAQDDTIQESRLDR